MLRQQLLSEVEVSTRAGQLPLPLQLHDRLTDWADQGNALEQALSLKTEENVTRGLNFVERFLLGTREGGSEEGEAHDQENRAR